MKYKYHDHKFMEIAGVLRCRRCLQLATAISGRK